MSGDGAAGHSRHGLSFGETSDLILHVLTATGYLAWRHDNPNRRRTLFWDDPDETPQGQAELDENGNGYAGFLDDRLRVYPVQDKMIVSLEDTHLDFVIRNRKEGDVDTLEVVTSDRCPSCGEIHDRDWARFVRVDSLAFHMERWVARQEAWNND